MMLPLLLALLPSALAAVYTLSDYHAGWDFYNSFEFQAIVDPTHGRVNYVDASTAIAKNLSYASPDTFIMRADYTTVLGASAPGRDSVRIQSFKSYATHVVILDIRHMPQGCATWPAAWETGPNWPYTGEVDVVEGVNDVSPNSMTLHTGPGCMMPATEGRAQTGTTETTDCDAFDNYNAGCGVSAPSADSYGPAFNANGGGWYAMERTTASIKIWFWPRNAPVVPLDVQYSSPLIDTEIWGTPTAYFPNTTSCDLASDFGENNLIFDLTMCGDWAGNVFNQDGCPGDCITYVDENPAAFVDAYWDLASVSIYE